MKHEFGGIWTRKKLEVLAAYLAFYTLALKDQPFRLHYADAFAGTGTHSPVTESDQDMLIPAEDFSGSVLTALDVEPGFHHYHFNDLNPLHVAELVKIKADYPQRDIRIHQQDANRFVPAFCGGLGSRDRAVLFLDPYSTQLDWATLGAIAKSERVDLWLLFPISVILRLTPNGGVRSEWRAVLNRLLGSGDWETALYKPQETPMIGDLFGAPSPEPQAQRVNADELARWVTGRLQGLFPFVAEPLLLRSNGTPLFLFYFAVSNKSEKAWGLAKRAANHIIAKFDGEQR